MLIIFNSLFPFHYVKYWSVLKLLTLSTTATLLTHQSRPKWTIHFANKSLPFSAKHLAMNMKKLLSEKTNIFSSHLTAPTFLLAFLNKKDISVNVVSSNTFCAFENMGNSQFADLTLLNSK